MTESQRTVTNKSWLFGCLKFGRLGKTLPIVNVVQEFLKVWKDCEMVPILNIIQEYLKVWVDLAVPASRGRDY